MGKVIIIGIDGVPFELIGNFTSKGIMPNLKEIIEDSILKKMYSSIPEVSSVAWSSIITGKNPATHGIFGFTDISGDYSIYFPNFKDLKSPPFWENFDKKIIIINLPSTYPVRKVNGIHISGFVSIDFTKSVYPVSLIPKLKEMGYKIDVDASKAHTSMELFLEDLDKTLQARIKTYRYLYDNYEWDIFFLVFTGTDRLMHFLWNCYENPESKFVEEFINHFRKIDGVIGEINRKLKDEDNLIIISDHGFGTLNYNVNINFFLKEKGYLKIEGKEYSGIKEGTVAFALDPARIYINLKGKYRNGSVEKSDYMKVVEEILNLFDEWEWNGEKIARDVYYKEEIYSGPYIENAPDIILVGNRGFNLKAGIKAEEIFTQDIFTGKHTQDNAFFLLKSKKKIGIPENISVYDFYPVIEEIIQ